MVNRERNVLIFHQRLMGWTLTQIGREHGISTERVRQILKCKMVGNDGENITRNASNLRKTERENERRQVIIALLNEGRTVAEIAEIACISRSFVYKTITLLRNEENLFSEITKYSKIDVVIARRMRAAGATLRTIAHRFHVSKSSVSRVLAKNG